MKELEKQIAALKNKYDRVCETHSDPAATAFGFSVMLDEALQIIAKQQKLLGEISDLHKAEFKQDPFYAEGAVSDFLKTIFN